MRPQRSFGRSSTRVAGTRVVAVLLPLSLSLLMGCERKQSRVTEDSSSKTKPPNPASGIGSNELRSTALLGGKTNFSVPFHGVIKAKEQRDLLLNSAEITYTIGDGKIRREAVRTAPGGKLAGLGLGSAGIICDLQAKQVVLYRTQLTKKGYIRMTLAEYQQLVTTSGGAISLIGGTALPLLTVKPDFWRHVGTFFVDVPPTRSADAVVNLTDACTINGLPCDLLTIDLGDVRFEVSHCQRIKADRQLLELVELRLPNDVTGFPVLMRRLQRVPVDPAAQGASRIRQLLQKSARWVADVAEKAMKHEIELLQITEGVPHDSTFTLSEAFTQCLNLDELRQMFQPPEGHHDDWD